MNTSFDGDWKAADIVESALRTVAESGIDSGWNGGARDFWLRVNGAEYFITMTRSKGQSALDIKVGAKKDQ